MKHNGNTYVGARGRMTWAPGPTSIRPQIYTYNSNITKQHIHELMKHLTHHISTNTCIKSDFSFFHHHLNCYFCFSENEPEDTGNSGQARETGSPSLLDKLLADEAARGKKLPLKKRKTASLFGLLSSSEAEKEPKRKRTAMFGMNPSDGGMEPRKKREVYISKASDAQRVAAKFAGATQAFGQDSQGIPQEQDSELAPEEEAETQQSPPWLHATKPKRKPTSTVTSASAAPTLPGIPVPPSHPPPAYSEAVEESAHATTTVAGFTVNKPADKLADM